MDIDFALDLTERLIPDDKKAQMGGFCRTSTRATLEDIAESGVLFIRPFGIIGGAITTSPINAGFKMAVERVFYAERNHRTLIALFDDWRRSQGAQRTIMGTADARMSRIYGKLGFDYLEGYYVRGE